MGGSDHLPHRTVPDWPVDVAALLDRLGIAHCTVLGYSGETPYAAAVARAMPERVEAAALVACVAHLAPGLDPGLDRDGLRLKAFRAGAPHHRPGAPRGRARTTRRDDGHLSELAGRLEEVLTTLRQPDRTR